MNSMQKDTWAELYWIRSGFKHSKFLPESSSSCQTNERVGDYKVGRDYSLQRSVSEGICQKWQSIFLQDPFTGLAEVKISKKSMTLSEVCDF